MVVERFLWAVVEEREALGSLLFVMTEGVSGLGLNSGVYKIRSFYSSHS